MTDEVRRLKNEYMKEWRSRNKEKVKAAQDKYWKKKALDEKVNIDKER